MAVTKKERRNKMLIVVIGTILLVVLYFYFTNKESKKAEESALSEQVEKIIGSDIEMDYPSSPREVIILFNNIMTCSFKENLDDDTLKKIISQERVLFDQELLDNNPLESQLADLKEEILDYKKAKRTIVTSAVDKSSSAEYWSKDDKDYASIVASYTLKDSEVAKTYERYILRKDEQDKWRILGWQIATPIDLDK